MGNPSGTRHLNHSGRKGSQEGKKSRDAVQTKFALGWACEKPQFVANLPQFKNIPNFGASNGGGAIVVIYKVLGTTYGADQRTTLFERLCGKLGDQ